MKPDFSEIFKIETNDIKPKRGRVLISEPFSVGDIFRRSVVLLTDYSKKDGAMGLILNKPIPEDKAEEIFLSEFNIDDLTVSVGGPVSPEKIFYLHTLNNKIIDKSIEIMPGLYFGGNFSQLKEMIIAGALPPNKVRFFAGYSGWSPNQLEDEIKRNSWLVKDIKSKEVLKVDKKIWTKQINQLEEKYKMWTLVPEDPHLN